MGNWSKDLYPDGLLDEYGHTFLFNELSRDAQKGILAIGITPTIWDLRESCSSCNTHADCQSRGYGSSVYCRERHMPLNNKEFKDVGLRAPSPGVCRFWRGREGGNMVDEFYVKNEYDRWILREN